MAAVTGPAATRLLNVYIQAPVSGAHQQAVMVEEAVGDLQQAAVGAVVAHEHACAAATAGVKAEASHDPANISQQQEN